MNKQNTTQQKRSDASHREPETPRKKQSPKRKLKKPFKIFLVVVLLVVPIFILYSLLIKIDRQAEAFLLSFEFLVTTSPATGVVIAAVISATAAISVAIIKKRGGTLKTIIVNIFKVLGVAAIFVFYVSFFIGSAKALAEYDIKNKEKEEVEASKTIQIPDNHVEIYIKNFGQKYIFICEGDTHEIIYDTLKKSLDNTLPSLEPLTADWIDNTSAGRKYYENKSSAETKYEEILSDRETGMSSIWKKSRKKYAKEIHEWYLNTANDNKNGTNETRQTSYIKSLNDVVPLLEKAKSISAGFDVMHTLTLRFVDLADAYQLIGDLDKSKEFRESAAINEAKALKIAIQNDNDEKKKTAIDKLIELYEIPKGMEKPFEPKNDNIQSIYKALVMLKDDITLLRCQKN